MSKYTVRNLFDLKDPAVSYKSPLAVIAHIDLDAFYAQLQQVRLGLDPTTPVCCRQWNSLIAVNYPARARGITRSDNVEEAWAKCPEAVLAHVATYKKGDSTFKFWDSPDSDNYKVSLDPFRKESRKIFRLFLKHCPRLQKGSIDETFADLGGLVYDKITELFPQVAEMDPSKQLNMPRDLPSDMTWQGDVYGGDCSTAGLDWDDVCLLIGSIIVDDIRKDLFSTYKYTSSAGVSCNKLLAKLGSGHKKPNGQTVIRKSAIHDFYSTTKLVDLWGFGGKLGEQILTSLDLKEDSTVAQIADLSPEKLHSCLDYTTADMLYKISHGEYPQEITNRVHVKSMNSVKQFNKPVRSLDDCQNWLKVFSADLYNRLIELEEELGVPQRAKTVVFGYTKMGRKHHNRQTPFEKTDSSTRIEYDDIYTTALKIIYEVGSEEMLPATSLSLSITGIESIVTSTLNGFFKRRKVDKESIKGTGHSRTGSGTESEPGPEHGHPGHFESSGSFERPEPAPTPTPAPVLTPEPAPESKNTHGLFLEQDGDKFACDECNKLIPSSQLNEHKDWHFAKRLQTELSHTSHGSPHRTHDTPIKGQTTLDFFKH